MKLRHAVAICMGFFTSLTSFGQIITEAEVNNIAANGSEMEIVMQNSTLMSEGYLYYAEILADRLLELNPQSSNYHYRKGFLLLEIRKDYIAAIPHFEMATKDTHPNADMFSTKDNSAPPDAFFHSYLCPTET